MLKYNSRALHAAFKNLLLDKDGFKTYQALWVNRLFLIVAFLFAFSEIYIKSLIILIFFIWITVVKKTDFLRVIREPVILWLSLLILAITLFPLITPHDHKYALKFLERFSFYLLIPIIMIATSIRRDYVIKMVTAFIFGMLLNELISYGILFGLWLHPIDGYPVYFMHHVFYSVLLSFTVMVLIYRFMIEKNLFLKIVEVIFILTMFGNLVISGGRTGQLTLVATFVLTFLFFMKINMKRLLIIMVTPMMLFSLTYNTYPKFQERIDTFIDDTKVAIISHEYTSSFGNRLFGYVITAKMLEVEETKHILLGFGIDNVQNEKKALIAKWFPKTPNFQGEFIQFHSSYVDAIWWSGVVGFFLMLSFLIAIIRVKIRDENVKFLKISLFFTILFRYHL
jgi:hypothetical protein